MRRRIAEPDPPHCRQRDRHGDQYRLGSVGHKCRIAANKCRIGEN
jgi:hypothetical protein